MFSNHRFGVGGLKHPGYNDAASGISAGASILGGLMGSDAAGDSADAANAGLLQAIQELKSIDKRTRSDTEPYRNLGSSSTNLLSVLLGLGDTSVLDKSKYKIGTQLTPVTAENFDAKAYLAANPDVAKSEYGSDPFRHYQEWGYKENRKQATDVYDENAMQDALKNTEGYGSLMKKFGQEDLNNDVVYNTGLQFGLDEGTKSLNNRARASGGTDSGSVLKALTRYGNDYATTKAGDAYNRYTGEQTNKYNMLTGASGIGQNAVNTSANSGTAIGSAIAGAQNSIGQNNAAARMGESNAWGSALGGISNAAQSYSLMSLLKGAK